ncbi:MAG: aldo/keto reductase [Candidatus Solibacter sp.]
MLHGVRLGLGLIGIGKRWGHVAAEPPSELDALELLEFALGLGVRLFDTASSYGASEERLASFLKALNPSERRELTIATKFGEHWDADRQEPFVDHSYEALRRSLDRSVARLGEIDILQLHKTTPEVLRGEDLGRAWEYASSLGVRALGASVSDLESAELVLADPRYQLLQLPYNLLNPKFGGVIDRATERGLSVLVNRPFAMGAMLHSGEVPSHAQAFEYILQRPFNGAILTGTKSKTHLAQNWLAFEESLRSQSA